MLRTLKTKRIDLPDGVVLYRNIYRVRIAGSVQGCLYWRGIARIDKMYRPVVAFASDSERLEGAIWKLQRTS